MTHSTTRILGAIAAVGMLGVLTPSTASASLSQCASYELCAWGGINYEGGVLPKIANGWYNFSGSSNDTASSVYNKISNRDGAFWESHNRSGARLCVNSASGMTYVGSSWNDEISSVEVYAGQYVC